MKLYILTSLALMPTPVLALSTQEYLAIGLFGGSAVIVGGIFGASFYKPFFISTAGRISRAVREGFVREAALAAPDLPLHALPSSSFPPIIRDHVSPVAQSIAEHAPVLSALFGS